LFVSLSQLHFAIKAKDQDRALEVAATLRYVPLRYAARLTALLADGNHPKYKAAADRLLVRVIQEIRPPLIETKRLADCLAHVHDYYWQHHAIAALHDVVGQLHRRHVRLAVDFDSERVIRR
jgi:hypothetical protein